MAKRDTGDKLEVMGLADEVRELMIATAGILDDALAYTARYSKSNDKKRGRLPARAPVPHRESASVFTRSDRLS